jgi:hypothetical protein
METFIYARAGKNDSYHQFPNIQDAANYLNSQKATRPITPVYIYGFSSKNFKGNNYVSIYHGLANNTFSKSLSVEEYDLLQSLLNPE